jgi:hypothetical protein
MLRGQWKAGATLFAAHQQINGRPHGKSRNRPALRLSRIQAHDEGTQRLGERQRPTSTDYLPICSRMCLRSGGGNLSRRPTRERPVHPAPLQSLASGPCSGAVRERAPTDTATALGALHRPGLRLPRAAPLARSFVAVGASWHTPQRARLERTPSLDERT